MNVPVYIINITECFHVFVNGFEVTHITTEDLRGYLTAYQTEKHLSEVTSSFVTVRSVRFGVGSLRRYRFSLFRSAIPSRKLRYAP